MNINKLPIGAAAMILPLFGAALLQAPCAHGFSLVPMTTSLEPSGPGASEAFQVTNDSDEPVAAEIYLLPRSPDIEGKEILDKVPGMEKLFLIYPPQVVIKPHDRRTVRVSWVGDPKPARELAFRIIAEQLPVQTEKKLSKAGGQIKVLLKYAGALYVTPPGARPDLSVKEVALSKNKPKAKGARLIVLAIENKGTAHQVLSHFALKLSSPSLAEPVEIEDAKLPELSGQNVLAGLTRRFTIEIPESRPLKEPLYVRLDFKE